MSILFCDCSFRFECKSLWWKISYNRVTTACGTWKILWIVIEHKEGTELIDRARQLTCVLPLSCVIELCLDDTFSKDQADSELLKGPRK